MARFGPSGIRDNSLLLRPYNPAQDIEIFKYCSGCDYGDLPIVPGYLPESHSLIQKGAKEIHVYITHGVLSGDAVQKIKKSAIKNLVITDTIDNMNIFKGAKNIELLSISGLMCEAIKRISNSTSVSDLIK